MPPSPEFIELLGRIFDSAREGDRKTKRFEERRREFIFPITDGLADYKRSNELYAHPEKAELHKPTISTIGLLYHIIPHLNAAGRLLLDHIPDAFAPPQEELAGAAAKVKPGVKRQ